MRKIKKNILSAWDEERLTESNKIQKGLAKAQSTVLADLVNYQEDSIVSRTLIDKKAGTVTVFAFDEEQGLSEHTAPYDAIVYIIDGEAEIIISGKIITAKEGEMVIMPAHQPHALKAVKKFEMLLIMIRS
jgi:quercetin dioxygenase-like cupin family protein